MKYLKFKFLTFLFISTSLFWACNRNTQWEGQAPIERVSTKTRPIQEQLRKTYDLGQGIFASNEFEGARLNGMILSDDTLLTALISPENTPINGSPWYAFKLWSSEKKDIHLALTYLDGYDHRYYPKLSKDGLNWTPLDSVNYFIDSVYKDDELTENISMKLTIGPDTLWVSAQELITSKHINHWMQNLAKSPFISMEKIGESHQGRPINMLKIGSSDDQKMIMVLSRQHPPEITGYLCMKSFIETLCEENELANKFRSEYNIYVIPLANPDGVDNGHWRHNAGGIDLNRDWDDFNQAETIVIRDFTMNKISETGGRFYFGVDFHSTSHDIYYTINPEKEGNMPGLVPEMITAMGNEIPDYEPNIRPNSDDSPQISSLNFFFYKLGAEALTYEIADDTPREFIQLKGRLTAQKLMELMLSK